MIDQMTEMKLTAESCRENYVAAHEAVKAIFDPIQKCFSEEDTTFEVSIYSHWNREINIFIKNDTLQWSSEVCRFTIKRDKENGSPYTLGFSYGSGGWRDGFDANRQLTFMSSVFMAGIDAEALANLSPITLETALDKYFEEQEVYNRVCSEITKMQNETKEIADLKRQKQIIEQLGFDMAKTGKEMFDDMTIGKTDSFECVTLGHVILQGDKVLVRKKEITIEKYSTTVVKVDNRRVAMKNFWKMDFSKNFIIPTDLRYNRAFTAYDTKSVTEIQTLLGAK
jgi:hypothetical protein